MSRPRSDSSSSVLPLHAPPANHFKLPRSCAFFPLTRWRSRNRLLYIAFAIFFVVIVFFRHSLWTFRRDVVYLLRPIWDTPDPPWRIIPHYPPPTTPSSLTSLTMAQSQKWCEMHDPKWSARTTQPEFVDAVLFSSELDMLELRIREYRTLVKTFVVVESDLTFSGQPKPLHFAQNRQRFELLAGEAGARIVYRAVTGEHDGLQTDLPSGSFDNEIMVRRAVSSTLSSLSLPPGSLVIQSDVDEIVSLPTLQLLATCQGYPRELHLEVQNYLYDFNHPLPASSYWRPHLYTVQGREIIPYHHSRAGDDLLAGAGWHCTFCFATLEEMRGKMKGYSHNDRLRDSHGLDEDVLRRRVCEGRDPFNMWPVSFSYHACHG